MTLKNSFLLFITWLSPLLALSQQPDTLAFRKIREIQVKAHRPTLFTPGSRQTKIDSAALSQQVAGNVADLLQTRTPIFVKTYGQNMLATVSFRGTSASQTAVLWNGLSITQPTLGLTDLSLLPVNALKEVQLLHGSGSANFGSGAIGGAILLNSASEVKPGFTLGAQQDLGSFGRMYSQLEGSFGKGKFGLDASVFHLQAQNDFPFTNTAKFGAPEERQENASQKQTGFTTNLNYRADEKNTFSLRNWFTHSNTQAQPTMVAANTHARNQNQNLRLMAEWDHFSNLGTTNLRAAYFNDQMHYRDDAQDSDSEVKTYQAQAEHGFIIKKKINLNVGAEMQHFAANVIDYGQKVSENRAAVFALLRYDVTPNLTLNANWRQAFIQRYDPPAAPTLGFNWLFLKRPSSAISWKGNAGRGYRVPTLNDRFWPPGNLHLKPEKSLNYETGLVYTFSTTNFSFETELTTYRMQVENWIQWVPGKSGLWAPENLKKVNARGLEYGANFNYKISDFTLSGGGNYAYTVSEQAEVYNQASELNGRQLIYVPYHTATAFTDLSFKNWHLAVNGQYTGRCFTTSENDRWLTSYALFTVQAGKTFRWQKQRFQVIVRVNNLGNTVYQTQEYYAMPGRHYNLSLRFHLN